MFTNIYIYLYRCVGKEVIIFVWRSVFVSSFHLSRTKVWTQPPRQKGLIVAILGLIWGIFGFILDMYTNTFIHTYICLHGFLLDLSKTKVWTQPPRQKSLILPTLGLILALLGLILTILDLVVVYIHRWIYAYRHAYIHT